MIKTQTVKTIYARFMEFSFSLLVIFPDHGKMVWGNPNLPAPKRPHRCRVTASTLSVSKSCGETRQAGVTFLKLIRGGTGDLQSTVGVRMVGTDCVCKLFRR